MSQSHSELRVIRRWWWVVLLTAALSLATSLWVTARQDRVYRAATMQVVVPNSRVKATDEILRSIDTLDRRNVLATFSRIPRTGESRDQAAAYLKLDRRIIDRYRIDASVLPGTNVLRIDVEGPDPERTAALANAVAAVTRERGREMYRIFKIETMARAVPPSGPIHPSPGRNLLAGAVVGLVLGALACFAVEHLYRGSRLPGGAMAESRG